MRGRHRNVETVVEGGERKSKTKEHRIRRASDGIAGSVRRRMAWQEQSTRNEQEGRVDRSCLPLTRYAGQRRDKTGIQ